MTTRDIRTSTPITVCDVCGRTLLRGERAHAYIDGGARRSVCELCTSRAVNEGWIREGSEPAYDTGRVTDRRRSLFGRLRARRDSRPESPEPEESEHRSVLERLRARDEEYQHEHEHDDDPGGYDYDAALAPAPVPAPEAIPPPVRARRSREPVREPRHVRAIPTSAEQKFAAAIDVFNASEHRKTVAGVARSLGMPTVAVLAMAGGTGLVAIVVSWELCWYRYEIDLSESVPGVQVAAQGYELDELQAVERNPNAVADEQGSLALTG